MTCFADAEVCCTGLNLGLGSLRASGPDPRLSKLPWPCLLYRLDPRINLRARSSAQQAAMALQGTAGPCILQEYCIQPVAYGPHMQGTCHCHMNTRDMRFPAPHLLYDTCQAPVNSSRDQSTNSETLVLHTLILFGQTRSSCPKTLGCVPTCRSVLLSQLHCPES